MKTLPAHIKSGLVLLAVILSIFWSVNAEAARGRPYINAAKTTFVTDTGTLMRGIICGSSLPAMIVITNYGCNALHLYPETASGGYAAGSNSNAVDAAVAMTRTNGLYLIITIGGGGVSNSNFITAFWNFYAPRYANETHVLYEIQNEATSGEPSSAAVIAVETNCYNIIRSNAPNTPVLFFSYVAFASGSGVVQDIHALGSGIDWNNAAVAFHGYGTGGPSSMQTCLQYVLNAGYPCFQTEFYRWPWGTGNFSLGANASMYQDTTENGIFERLNVSWLSFMVVNVFTNDLRFRSPITNAGVYWVPDYGNWPSASRSVFGNGGNPWFTTNLSGILRIQAEDFDNGGQGVAYNDTTSSNLGGQYRTGEGVDIETTADTGGGYDVGWIVSGEWLEYTTWIYEAGFYDVKLRVASPQATNQLSLSFYGTNVSGTVTFPGTGGNQTWTTITNTVFLKPGQQIMRVTALSSGFNLNWYELTPTATGILSNGTYKVINRNSGLALEVAGAATTNGANIDQSTYTGNNSQKWTFSHQGGNQYLLSNVLSGKTIDEDDYTALSGDYIQQYTIGGTAGTLNQRYIFVPAGSGYYQILNVNSGLALEVAGAATTNGAIIDQSEYTSNPSQQWLVLVTNAIVPPAVPTALSATASSYDNINLNWSTSSNATGYNLKRAAVSGGPYITIATGVSSTNYSDSGLSNGTTYYYVVSAVNVNSNTESGDSIEANATTLAAGVVIVDDADVTGVAITGVWTASTSTPGYYGPDYLHDGDTGSTGGKSVRFSPDLLPATASYRVYLNWPPGSNRASNTPLDINYAGGTTTLSLNQQTGGNWQLLGTFNFNAGTAGNVLVRNDGANGFVIADAVKFVQLPPVAPVVPAATPGSNQVTLSWPVSSGVTSYNVKRASVSGGTYTTIASPTTASYIDTTVTNGMTYFYVISAVNVSVESGNSPEVSATPTSLAATTLTATVVGNSFILTWPADHIGWHLQIQTNSLTVGLGTNWLDLTNTKNVSSFTNPINPAAGAVFHRLTYP